MKLYRNRRNGERVLTPARSREGIRLDADPDWDEVEPIVETTVGSITVDQLATAIEGKSPTRRRRTAHEG